MQIKDLKVKEVSTLTVMIKSVNVGRTTAQKPYLKFLQKVLCYPSKLKDVSLPIKLPC